MSPTSEEFYRKRIAELEAENARLRGILDKVKSDRRRLPNACTGRSRRKTGRPRKS